MTTRFLLALFLSIKLLLATEVSNLNPVQTFEEIAKIIEKHYYRKIEIENDWKSHLKIAREKIHQDISLTAKYQIIENLVSIFEHSHLTFRPPHGIHVDKKQRYQIKKSAKQATIHYHVDFEIEFLHGQYFIKNLKPTSSSHSQGLRNKMKLLKIDELALKKIDPNLISPKHLQQTMSIRQDDKLKLLVVGAYHKKKWITLTLSPAEEVFNNFASTKIKEKVEVVLRQDGILYLSFSAFTFEQVGKIKQAIQENKQAKGMILDLRDNPGGTGMLACGIALEFCEENYSLGTMTGPEMTLRFPVFAQPDPYKGPLVILINENSFSTSEILARGMQVAEEAILVGSQTQGLALPSMIVHFSDGSRFQYPVADFKDTTGILLEAKGVEPDFLVRVNIAHSQNGVDPQLEKAVELILK